MADLLHLLAEPRRQRILRFVWLEERSAGDIAAACPDVTFGAVSQHLKRLRDAGAISLRVDGRKRYYRADHARLGALKAALEQLWFGHLVQLKTLAEAEQKRTNTKRRKNTLEN